MDDNQHSKISTPMSLSSAFVDEAVKALEESGCDVDIAFCTEKSAVSTRHNRDSRRPSLGQYQLSAKALPSDSDYLPSYIDNEEKRVADEKIAADIELQYSPTLEREAGGYTGRHEKALTEKKKIATDVLKLQYSPTLEQQAVGPTAQHEKANQKMNANVSVSASIRETFTSLRPTTTRSSQRDKKQDDIMLEEGTFPFGSASPSRKCVTSAAVSTLPTPIPPQQILPGVVAVPGIDGIVHDYDDEYSVTEMASEVQSGLADRSEPVSAEIVDVDKENQIFEERLDREIAERERERMSRENTIPEAEVVNEMPSRMSSTRVKILSGLGASFVILAIVLGTVLHSQETQQEPPPNPTEALVTLLSSVSHDGGTALLIPETPQNDALIWLGKDSNLDTYSDDKKIQRFSLATLYYSTDGSRWGNNDGWVSDSEECDWYNTAKGSFCENGFVVELSIVSNMLAGTIPNELTLLSSSVDFLNLGSNSLAGQEIAMNRLTGFIPSEIGLMGNLNELSIHFNRLEGQIPSEIGLLTKLTLLSLWGNNLTGRIPPEIGNLTNLSELLVSLLYFRILPFLLILSQTVLQIHYGYSTTEI